MKLELDTSKTYAIALEGGGAKGGYEVGVWKALEDLGIRYNAVSGTSVGALNGAMMAMRDLPGAIRAWEDMRLDKIMNLDSEQEKVFQQYLNGSASRVSMLAKTVELIRSGGLDVSPMRAWAREVIDPERIRNSDVELFVATVSLSDRKGMEVRLNDLGDEEIWDMLLASAYHPTFKMERLGGKYYADGGFIDSLPLHVLVENGYKDIIAVRIPSKLAHTRRFKIPDDVHVTYIDTDSDLGNVLNFNSEQSKRDMAIGYMDAQHDLCGLYGRQYYIDRTLSERRALQIILDSYERKSPVGDLRELCERELPRMARRLGVNDGGYYELLIALLELSAEGKGIERMKIYTDTEFLTLIAKSKENEEN